MKSNNNGINLQQIQQDFKDETIVCRATMVAAIDYAVQMEAMLAEFSARATLNPVIEKEVLWKAIKAYAARSGELLLEANDESEEHERFIKFEVEREALEKIVDTIFG